MKLFFCLTCMTPITFMLAIVPVARTLLREVGRAIVTSKNDAWAKKMWWNWYGSWVFFGGPFGRWMGGAIHGFCVLKTIRSDSGYSFLGRVAELPHLRIFAVATPAMIISIFCLVSAARTLCQRLGYLEDDSFQILALMTIRSILQGTTAIENLKSSRSCRSGDRAATFVCIPSQPESREISIHPQIAHVESILDVYTVLSTERLYDLGPKANWNVFIKMPLSVPEITRWFA